MLSYRPTPLESWVSEKYKRMKMVLPSDLSETRIAMVYDIYLFYKPIKSKAYENGRFKSITIDSRLDRQLQREQFYHEWCHILRHTSNPKYLPKSFIDWQEWDARNFTRYAAIPYHMVSLYNLWDPHLIDHWQEDYKVTRELCHERIQNIKRRILLERRNG
ncbi:ImmA/IrrE family metallo-endopeptidase [Fictibacillus sp. Mic-4]|uniref:ImmA/IrrE family metallo-endopeptidase n=1 Tax=Fictibacillus sp. Mic-4 TaxID=3132826 RepID=UPI003CF12A80